MKKVSASIFALILCFLTFVLGLTISPSFFPWVQGMMNQQSGEFSYDFGVLREVNGILEKGFYGYEDVSLEERESGIIQGFTNSLGDRHTNYFPPVDAEIFRESIRGDFEGIGAFVDMTPEGILIDRLIKGAPAQKAGILQNDIVTHADDTGLAGLDINEAITHIKGPKGSEVMLTILRASSLQPLEIPVVRDRVEIPTITYNPESIDREQYAHIELSSFSATSYIDFLKVIEENALQNTQGIILDLRYNGGGLLDSAVDILSLFVDRGEKAVTIRGYVTPGNDGEVVYSTTKPPFLQNTPLVILINGSSASASEVVAGALQDYDRAIILGEQSYGKGSVQQARTLSNGGEVKYTTSFWYTPNEQKIEGNGVTPDEEVILTLENYENDEDPQLDRAVEVLDQLQKSSVEEIKSVSEEEGE